MNNPPQQLRHTTTTERQAGAIDEIRQLHHDYDLLLAKSQQDRRTIERQEDRIAMLVEQMNTSEHERKVMQRKLIRLAAAMSGIGRLTQDAEEIMRSVQDWQETEEEAAAETESARGAVAALPQRPITDDGSN